MMVWGCFIDLFSNIGVGEHEFTENVLYRYLNILQNDLEE